MKLHFIANCVYGTHLAGGDIHFFEMARAASEAGYEVNFFGGHVLKEHVAAQKLNATITLTEQSPNPSINLGSLRGQIALFSDYYKRYRGTLQRLKQIEAGDIAYATTDYWFDVLPVVKSGAHGKMMIWHMQAPSLGEIIARNRADVDALRLASFHYWNSQRTSLREFRRCSAKRLLYVHPAMRAKLLASGFAENEIKYVSFGVDPKPPGIGESAKGIYDAVWIGRVHRQKGIDDLLKTLQYLSAKIPNFRALIIGKVKSELQPLIEQLGLAKAVDFSGFVSEDEKFRLFASSRVYLMPSRFEGSPRVIGEALVCRLPVVAYDVPTYRPIFGEFLSYVPCYDVERFGQEAERQILKARADEKSFDESKLQRFIEECSWETAKKRFMEAVGELQKPYSASG